MRILRVFILVLPAFIALGAGGGEGKRVFDGRGCGECHRVDAQGPFTVEDRLARKGPDLWFAGSKFKKGFLEAWLARPEPIRPLVFNSLTEKNKGGHPRLDANEAGAVAAYLESLKVPLGPYGIEPRDTMDGRVVFLKKGACYGCHLAKGRTHIGGGLSAPSLIEAGQRLNAEWVYAYLKSPKDFGFPDGMPVYAGVLSDGELRDVAAYIGSLK